jgi:hypothetical protein
MLACDTIDASAADFALRLLAFDMQGHDNVIDKG